jgi:excisionase family DNA binding protein
LEGFPEMDRAEVLSVNKASQYCKVSPQTIVNWINVGKLKAYRTAGGHRRIVKSDLDEFLERHNMPAFGSSSFTSGKERTGARKILVVDDDSVIVQTITAALEEDPHKYEVLSAGDGFEAGLQVSRFNPDLVILDLRMPNIDGYEVCRALKKSNYTKHVKIIVLSAFLDDENTRKLLKSGADLCFSKPLPLEMLKEEIARILFPETVS